MDCLTILIFDVDDTLLKEVPVTAIDKPNVQTLKYKPSEYSAKKYRERLVTRDASKVIHYEFVSDDTIISTVKINPKFEHMESIRSIADKCYLASANDDNRTQAVLEQLQFGGYTLQELGFEFIPREVFVKGMTKDLEKIKHYINCAHARPCNITFFDDKTMNIKNGMNAKLVPVAPFKPEFNPFFIN